MKWAKQLLGKRRKTWRGNKTFSDEKRFLLDGPDGMQYYCLLDGEERTWYGKKNFSEGLMVKGGTGTNGTTSLHFCDRNMDSEYYQHVLQENYLSFHQPEFVFVPDNATPHISESTKEFFRQHNIIFLV